MANVLVVAALQLSDPMLFAVLVKANDSLLHGLGIRGSALEVIGVAVLLRCGCRRSRQAELLSCLVHRLASNRGRVFYRAGGALDSTLDRTFHLRCDG